MGHKSDCAKHSEPAYPAGECDCGYDLLAELREGCDADRHTVTQCNAYLMCLCQEAADEITRLRTLLQQARADALREFLEDYAWDAEGEFYRIELEARISSIEGKK